MKFSKCEILEVELLSQPVYTLEILMFIFPAKMAYMTFNKFTTPLTLECVYLITLLKISN